MSEIAIAFDVPTLDDALALDEKLGEGPEYAKIGLQLFTAEGPNAVRKLRERNRRVFLDLKLHDIPNTVKGAAAEAAKLGADLLTVHATGGSQMISAARDGIEGAGGETRIVAVTVLTSINAFNVPPGFEQPFMVDMVAMKLLTMSLEAGAAGIVCSAADLDGIRYFHKEPFFSVTPGIRMAGGATNDQKRVTTVSDAVRAGAGMLVIGRAITAADNPKAALEAARRERDETLAAATG